MKRAAIVSLCLILSFFIASAVFADETYYARCNIKVLKGNNITWVNWQAAPYTVPAGTKLKVTRNGKKATFVREITAKVTRLISGLTAMPILKNLFRRARST